MIKKSEELLGADHPDILGIKMNYANTLSGLEKYEEAEIVCSDMSEKSEEVLGPEHPDTLKVKANYAETLFRLKKP